MAPSHEIYAKELQHLHHGYPLWDPEPTEHGQAQIGDVSFIYRGAFHRLHLENAHLLELLEATNFH